MRRLSISILVILAAPAGAAAQESWGEWKSIHAPQGFVTLTGRKHKDYYRAYLCPSAKRADAVIYAIARVAQRGDYVPQQVAAMKVALARQRCKPAAKGRYRVEDLLGDTQIDHGFEASENWSSLKARSATGSPIGLVYDSSPYAITD
ncbi:MAG: hypothetical protein V4808_02880 [Pseudomonadota bacterium]